MEEVYKLWDWLVDNGIATEEEIALVCGINGRSIDTLNDILYYRTGYRDREQIEAEE